MIIVFLLQYIYIYIYIYIFMICVLGFKVPYFKTSGWLTQTQHVVHISKLTKLCSTCRQYVYNFRFQTSAAILTVDTTSVEDCAFTANLCPRRQEKKTLLKTSCKVPDIFLILYKFGFFPPIFTQVPISIVTEIRAGRAALIRTDGRTWRSSQVFRDCGRGEGKIVRKCKASRQVITSGPFTLASPLHL